MGSGDQGISLIKIQDKNPVKAVPRWGKLTIRREFIWMARRWVAMDPPRSSLWSQCTHSSSHWELSWTLSLATGHCLAWGYAPSQRAVHSHDCLMQGYKGQTSLPPWGTTIKGWAEASAATTLFDSFSLQPVLPSLCPYKSMFQYHSPKHPFTYNSLSQNLFPREHNTRSKASIYSNKVNTMEKKARNYFNFRLVLGAIRLSFWI